MHVEDCPFTVPYFQLCPTCGGVDDNWMLHSLRKVVINTPEGKEIFYKCHACGITISRDEYVNSKKANKEKATNPATC